MCSATELLGVRNSLSISLATQEADANQAAAAEARAKELQEELTATYKDKARVAEELVAAGRQLQIVRESNEAQARGPHCVLSGMSVGQGLEFSVLW